MKLFFLFPLTWLAFFSFVAQAQEEWLALVLTTPVNIAGNMTGYDLAPAYKKTEDAITAQLVSADIEVSDKSPLPNGENMTDQQLFSLNREDINLAIRYRLDVTEESSALVKKWHLHLSAYAVDLETKNKIETHSEDRLFSGVPNQCDRQCFNLWLARQAGLLAQDLGAILVEKINSLPRRYRYELTFQDFTPNELVQIHDYLKKVDGYLHVALLEKYETRQQWLHQIAGRKYRYVSHMPADVLDIALQKQLSSIGIPVRHAKNSGRKFVLIRSGVPYLAWYIGGCIGLILLIYSLYALQIRQKHQRVLSRLAHGRHAQQWLDYYKKLSLIAVPEVRDWHQQQKNRLDEIKKSAQLSEQAWLYADQGEYQNAQLKVEQALTINSDNTLAQALKDNIVDFQRGYDRFIRASNEMTTHPQQAKNLLDQAKALNPHLSEKIASLSKKCQRILDQTTGLNVLEQAQQALQHQAYYQAYGLIDQYLCRLTPDACDSETVSLLAKLRADVDSKVTALRGSIIAQQELAGYQLFTENKLEIARKIADPINSFAIGYKRISRLGKQCKLVRKGNDFYVTDLGSSNGSIYGESLLLPHQAVRVTKGKNLVLGGGIIKNTNAAVCQLELNLATHSSNALIVKLNKQPLQFIDDSSLAIAWPSLDADLASSWVLMGEILQIGIDGQGKLDLGCLNNSEPLARLIYQNGFYLQPELNNNKETQLLIDQQPIYGKVPLQQNISIAIANRVFSFHRVDG